MSHTSRRALALSLLAAALLLPADVRIPAQSRPALDVAESGRWETLVAAEPRLGLSPDGQVVTYRIDRSNWDDEMRVTRVADGRTFVVPYGRDPQYAANGRSLLYTIGQATGARSRGDTADGLGLLDLTTFTEARIAGVDDYAVSADGAFLEIGRAHV